MGNCLRHDESSKMVWAGDDWGSVTYKSSFEDDDDENYAGNVERHRLLLDDRLGGFCLSSSAGAGNITREVKIKITKKELEKLLGRVDIKGLSPKQVLAPLIDAADRYDEHQRSWRPALQSIPEID